MLISYSSSITIQMLVIAANAILLLLLTSSSSSSPVLVFAQNNISSTTTATTTLVPPSTTTTTTTTTLKPKTHTVTWNNTKTLSFSQSEYELAIPRMKGLPNQNELRVATEIIGIIAGFVSSPLTSMTVARGMSMYHLAGCNARTTDYEENDNDRDRGIEWVNSAVYFPETFFPAAEISSSSQGVSSTRGSPVRGAVVSFLVLFAIVLVVSIIIGYLSFFGWSSCVKCSCGWTDLEWWWALFSIAPIPKYFALCIGLVGGFWFRVTGVLAGAAERSSFLLDVIVLTILPIVVVVSFGGYFFFNTFRPIVSKFHGTKVLGLVECTISCDADLIASRKKKKKSSSTSKRDDNDDNVNPQEDKKNTKNKKKNKQQKAKNNISSDDREENNNNTDDDSSSSSDSDEDENDEEKEPMKTNNNKRKKDRQEGEDNRLPKSTKKWKLRLLRFLNSSIGRWTFVGDLQWETKAQKKPSTSRVLINRCGQPLLTAFTGLGRLTNKTNLFSHTSNSIYTPPSSFTLGGGENSHAGFNQATAAYLQQHFDSNNSISSNNNAQALEEQLLQNNYSNLSIVSVDDTARNRGARQLETQVVSIRRQLTPYSFFIHISLCSLICFLCGIAQTSMIGTDPSHPQNQRRVSTSSSSNNDNTSPESVSSSACSSIEGLVVFFEVIHIIFFLFNHLYLRPVLVPLDNFLNGVMDLCVIVATSMMTNAENAAIIQELLAGSMIACCCLMMVTRLVALVGMKISDNAIFISQWRYTQFMLNKMKNQSVVAAANANQNHVISSDVYGGDEGNDQEMIRENNNNTNNNIISSVTAFHDEDRPKSGITPLRSDAITGVVQIDLEDEENNNMDTSKSKTSPSPPAVQRLQGQLTLASNSSAYFPVREYQSPLPQQQKQQVTEGKESTEGKKEWQREFEDIDAALRTAHAKGDENSAAHFKGNLDKLFQV